MLVITMPDLRYQIKHLKADIEDIHDKLEHLNTHSKVCNDLVKESNLREAIELFMHLEQIDNRVHEVENHLVHLKDHIEQSTAFSFDTDPLDIDDLKHDAMHTSMDLKDIHNHIEHLIIHANMCREILAPSAMEELRSIKEHLTEIDTKAHELLAHVKSIRGGISSEYSEFIWSIPDGFDEFLEPSEMIDCSNQVVKEMALKLVDGCDTIQIAVVTILCYSRDFIGCEMQDDKDYSKASQTIESSSGTSISKAILACALARAVSIPSRIQFAHLSKETLSIIYPSMDITQELATILISWPEFHINDDWNSAAELFELDLDFATIHEKLDEFGIPKCNTVLTTTSWRKLPSANLEQTIKYPELEEFLTSTKFTKPEERLDKRLFAGLIYLGEFQD